MSHCSFSSGFTRFGFALQVQQGLIVISFRYKRKVPAEIMGTILGVLPRRILVFWDLYWGLLVLGDYHNG